MKLQQIFILFFCNLFVQTFSKKVDPTKCLVWGPGLRDQASLPVRYFYIQARDKNSNM